MAATKKGAKKTAKKPVKARKTRARRSMDERIEELRKKIQELEARKNLKEIATDPVFKHFRAARRALEKAVEGLDARSSKFDSGFVKASRQYLQILNSQLDGFAGRRRRGRKPKMDLS